MLMDIQTDPHRPCCFGLLEVPVVNIATRNSAAARRVLMETGFLQTVANVFRRSVEGSSATQLELRVVRASTSLLLMSRLISQLARPTEANHSLVRREEKIKRLGPDGKKRNMSLGIPESFHQFKDLVDQELHMSLRGLGFVETSIRLLSTKRLDIQIRTHLLEFLYTMALADKPWKEKKFCNRSTFHLLAQNWNFFLNYEEK